MLWWILVFCIVAMAAIFLACRPATMYNTRKPGAYVLVNKMTGYPAFGGRLFRSPKAAIRAIGRASRHDALWGLCTYEIMQTR